MLPSLSRRAFAEALGTAWLVLAVVGSGIAAERLSPDDVGLQLLENAIATAAALVAIILVLGPVSGAHLNPVITLAKRLFGGMSTGEAAAYAGAQVAGGAIGAVAANVIFALPAVSIAAQGRSAPSLWTSEVLATFGLVVVVFGLVRGGRSTVAPVAVAAYIGGAYFFTSSTSFANPAVTLARTLSDTFTGIAPGSVAAFVVAQVIGALTAVAAVRVLYPSPIVSEGGAHRRPPIAAPREPRSKARSEAGA